MATDQTADSRHIPELQSLRGIAACAVMAGHALLYFDNPEWFHRAAWVCNGRMAVIIFFVLSGYVLTRSLQRSAFDRRAVLRFYVQRIFRIYPALWVASALSLAYVALLHWQIQVPDTSVFFRGQFRPDRYNLTLIALSFAGVFTFLVPQLWTIFVEIIASAFMPALAFVTWHRRRWLLPLLAVLVGVSFLNRPGVPYNFVLFLMDFVVGAALTGAGDLFRKMPTPVLWLGLALLPFTQFMPFDDYYAAVPHLLESTLAAVVIGMLIAQSGRASTGWLRTRFMLNLGDSSYSIYLLHYVVICTLGKCFALVGWSYQPILQSFELVILTCVITVPLAGVVYRHVEMPGIALGKRLMGRKPTRDAPVRLAA